MERLLTFEIAKKLAKPGANASGLMLRSASGDSTRIALLISTGGKEGNDRVRAAVADYRLRTGRSIEYAIRGKSVEIVFEGSGAAAGAMDFIKDVNFANEEINDIADFCDCYGGAEFAGEPFEPVGLEADEGVFRIKLSLVCDSGIPDEDIYASIMPALIGYNMGIVKGNI